MDDEKSLAWHSQSIVWSETKNMFNRHDTEENRALFCVMLHAVTDISLSDDDKIDLCHYLFENYPSANPHAVVYFQRRRYYSNTPFQTNLMHVAVEMGFNKLADLLARKNGVDYVCDVCVCVRDDDTGEWRLVPAGKTDK